MKVITINRNNLAQEATILVRIGEETLKMEIIYTNHRMKTLRYASIHFATNADTWRLNSALRCCKSSGFCNESSLLTTTALRSINSSPGGKSQRASLK